jgi:hypothetical protein
VAESARHEPADGGVHGWALRASSGLACLGCGATPHMTYQLRRLTPARWTDVAGQVWCLRCWSAHSGLSHPLSA